MNGDRNTSLTAKEGCIGEKELTAVAAPSSEVYLL